MDELAILGGKPVFDQIASVNRNKFSLSDKCAVNEFLESPDSLLSYYGDEGLQSDYESELKSYFGAKHCILVNSGTNALFAAYFALGLMPGDEVIVPAHSFYAIATPLILLNINVVFADCDPSTGLINPQDVLNKITSKTKVVAVNHLCGDSIDMNAFARKLRESNIRLIEDISLSFGGSDSGQKLGTFGDIACCSLGSTKLLSGGQGGFLVTNNTEYYERVILLGCFGKRAYQNVMNPFYRQFVATSYGLNIRMHTLAIAASYNRFKFVDQLIHERHTRYNKLAACMDAVGILQKPRKREDKFRGAWHGFYAMHNMHHGNVSTTLLTKALRAEGLDVTHKAHYPLMHTEKIFTSQKDGVFRQLPNPFKTNNSLSDCPGAEQYNESIISFPLFLDEDMKCIDKYCFAIEKVLTQIDKLECLSE